MRHTCDHGAGALARTYVVRVELRAGGDGDLAGDDDEDQDEESEESDSDESRDGLIEKARASLGECVDEEQPGGALLNMKFMVKAREAQRARAREGAEKLLEELEADNSSSEDDDEDGWRELFEGLEGDEGDSGPSGSVGSPSASADLGAAVEDTTACQSDDLVHRLCSVDASEVFSLPRVGKEALKFYFEVGDAMDLTTG